MIDIGKNGLRVDREPNICPVCNQIISPNRIDIYKEIWTNDSHWSNFLDVLYECPSIECGHLFLSHFNRLSNNPSSINNFFTYSHSSPQKFNAIEHDQRIASISPFFVIIFNQSANAEELKLTEICGIGYRKALEFLIKDYCIYLNNEKSDTIKSMPLMQCINTFIHDHNIKECATRAVWLGNDETHYEKKWSLKNIDDLKLLINLSTHWIVSNIMTQEYIQSMQRT